MRRSNEYTAFNRAMDSILRADPAKVKAEMEREIEGNAKERAAKGEKKRGRKPKSAEHGS